MVSICLSVCLSVCLSLFLYLSLSLSLSLSLPLEVTHKIVCQLFSLYSYRQEISFYLFCVWYVQNATVINDREEKETKFFLSNYENPNMIFILQN